jgi:hypothetical protein
MRLRPDIATKLVLWLRVPGKIPPRSENLACRG